MRVAVLVFLIVSVGIVWAADEAQIKELIKKLGDDEWRVREEAQEKLESLGAEAAPLLKEAYKNADTLEMRIRLFKLLKNIKELSPEDTETLMKLAKQFFEVKDPQKRGIVQKMRSIENASFWLFSRFSSMKAEKDREDWARLLFWFEFGKSPKFLNDKNTLYEEVLLQIIWHPFTRMDTQVSAVKALGEVGSMRVIGTLAAAGSGELSSAPEYEESAEKKEKLAKAAKDSLLSILKRGDTEGRVPKPDNEEVLSNWWSSVRESQKDADEDYNVRQKEEEQRQNRMIPFLGVASAVANVNEKVGGALVMRAEAGTGAERAGIRPDDLIVELDGWKIECWNDLIFAIRHCEPGDKVPIVIKRAGETIKTEVEITRRPPGM
ncbi:MAG: PDZ domain-containing protein [Planctomycetota bacterium]|nr:PDZ domain-containing protein [Planctomycetota bacterium]